MAGIDNGMMRVQEREGLTARDRMLAEAIRSRDASGTILEEERKSEAAYYGGKRLHQYIEGYSRTEDNEKLQWRRQRSTPHYHPYPRLITGKYCDGVFGKGGVTRDTSAVRDKEFTAWVDDEYAQWVRLVLAPALVRSREVFVFMEPPDTMPEDGYASYREQQIDRGWVRPDLVRASEVHNFRRDRFGALVWISRRWTDAKGKTRYEVLDDLTRYILDEGGTIISEEAHGFDSLPALRFTFEEDASEFPKDPIGIALLDDVTNLSIANLQNISQLVETEYFHLNVQLVMDEADFQRTQQTGRGNAAVMLRGKDTQAPFFLQKPEMEIRTLRELVFTDNPGIIMKVARLRDAATDQTVPTSGVAKVMDAVPEFRILETCAKYFQQADEGILRFVAENYAGRDLPEVTCKYPTTFDLKTPMERLTELNTLADGQTANVQLPRSRTFLVLQTRKAYESIDPDIAEKDWKTIDAELESTEHEEEAMTDEGFGDEGFGEYGDELAVEPSLAGAEDLA